MDLTQLITDIFKDWAPVVLAIIGFFAALATVIPTPTETSGKAYRIFYSIFSWIAMNFGKAKNAHVSKSQDK